MLVLNALLAFKYKLLLYVTAVIMWVDPFAVMLYAMYV